MIDMKVIVSIIILSIFMANMINIFGETKTLLTLPMEVKCFFNEEGCQHGDIDTNTIIHGSGMFFVGIAAPKHHTSVIIALILTEILKPYVGINPRYIINPLVGLTTYSLGSMITG
jgi:hypothetical protein